MNAKAVFLDRDGVINRKAPEGEYIKSPDELVVLPRVPEALRRLREAGYLLVVVTNQRGIARGLMTVQDLRAVHAHLQQVLTQAADVEITAFYSCPHNLHTGCQCRKPQPGLLFKAAQDLRITLERSWMVGDMLTDVEAGRQAGCRTVWIHDEHSTPSLHETCQPDVAAANLWEAAKHIVLWPRTISRNEAKS